MMICIGIWGIISLTVGLVTFLFDKNPDCFIPYGRFSPTGAALAAVTVFFLPIAFVIRWIYDYRHKVDR